MMSLPYVRRLAVLGFVLGLVFLTTLNISWFVARSSRIRRLKSQDGKPGPKQTAHPTEQKKAPGSLVAAKLQKLGPTHYRQNWSSEIEDVLAREMRRRREVLSAACSRHKVPRRATGYSASFFDHIIVLDPYRLLFAFVPKVSCTAWKRVFLDLMGKNDSFALLRTLDKYSTEERHWRLETYRKVVFVREPVTRLLSAWMDKFRDGTSKTRLRWAKYFGPDIVRKYRRGSKADDLSGLINVTFVEFARYVTSLGPHYEMDPITDHFLPQSELTNPCQIDYQFIGHFENLALEGPYLLRWLSVDHLVSFPRYHPSAASRSLKSELMHVPLEVLHGLSKLYKRDYDMFGYSFMETLGTI